MIQAIKTPVLRAVHLAAFCQRCHMLHDKAEHRRRRWLTLF